MRDLIEREAVAATIKREFEYEPVEHDTLLRILEAHLARVPASTRYAELERAARAIANTAQDCGNYHMVATCLVRDLRAALAALDGEPI